MDYRVTGSELTTVADAIRQKGGTSERLVWPGGFKSAVDGISGGSGITAEDEGKVVSNGTLVEQTAISVSTNGTYDTTTNDEVVVDVTIPLMSADTRGGAKVGTGLSMDGESLRVDLSQESDGTVEGSLVGLTAKGWAEQDGTPSPDYPQEIQVARGRNLLNLTKQVDGTDVFIANATNVSVNDQTLTMTASNTNPWFGEVAAAGLTWSAEKGALIEVEGGASYVLSQETTVFNQVFVTEYDAYRVSLGYSQRYNKVSFTTSPNARYISLRIGVAQASAGSVYSGRIQLELGSTPTPYVPYGHVGLEVRDSEDNLLSTTPIPLPSRGWVGSLPDGTADTLSLVGAGKVTWELTNAMETFDGSDMSGWSVSGNYKSSGGGFYNKKLLDTSIKLENKSYTNYLSNVRDFINANDYAGVIGYGHTTLTFRMRPFETSSEQTIPQLQSWLQSHNLTVLYPLATPVTESLGYIEDWPTDIPEGATLSIRELDNLGVRYCIDGSVSTLARQWYERARSEYEDRITSLESAVADLVTGA